MKKEKRRKIIPSFERALSKERGIKGPLRRGSFDES